MIMKIMNYKNTLLTLSLLCLFPHFAKSEIETEGGFVPPVDPAAQTDTTSSEDSPADFFESDAGITSLAGMGALAAGGYAAAITSKRNPKVLKRKTSTINPLMDVQTQAATLPEPSAKKTVSAPAPKSAGEESATSTLPAPEGAAAIAAGPVTLSTTARSTVASPTEGDQVVATETQPAGNSQVARVFQSSPAISRLIRQPRQNALARAPATISETGSDDVSVQAAKGTSIEQQPGEVLTDKKDSEGAILSPEDVDVLRKNGFTIKNPDELSSEKKQFIKDNFIRYLAQIKSSPDHVGYPIIISTDTDLGEGSAALRLRDARWIQSDTPAETETRPEPQKKELRAQLARKGIIVKDTHEISDKRKQWLSEQTSRVFKTADKLGISPAGRETIEDEDLESFREKQKARIKAAIAQSYKKGALKIYSDGTVYSTGEKFTKESREAQKVHRALRNEHALRTTPKPRTTPKRG